MLLLLQLQKILKQSWYLCEETAVYALFTSNNYKVDDGKKTAIAEAILATTCPSEFRRGPPSLTKSINKNTSLKDLIGPQSWFLFKLFGTEHKWLHLPVKEWGASETYNKMKYFVQTVKVVNDEQKASIFQAVEKHRQEYPDFKKSTLAR